MGKQTEGTAGVVRIGRRVVTGVDREGRSRVESEEPVPVNATWSVEGAKGLDFWTVREVPASIVGELEPKTDWVLENRAPAGGIVGRLITWAPGFEYPVHTTPTLDFGIILSGQLELILESETRVLNPGDVVVQRGTAHGWRVIGPNPCTWAVVLIDAQPRA